MPLEKLLKPTESEQTMALWNSISEILWNVGEKTKCCVCLPGDVPHISHSHAYFQDNVTEKVRLVTKLSNAPPRLNNVINFICSCGSLNSTNWKTFKSSSNATSSISRMTLVPVHSFYSTPPCGRGALKTFEPTWIRRRAPI